MGPVSYLSSWLERVSVTQLCTPMASLPAICTVPEEPARPEPVRPQTDSSALFNCGPKLHYQPWSWRVTVSEVLFRPGLGGPHSALSQRLTHMVTTWRISRINVIFTALSCETVGRFCKLALAPSPLCSPESSVTHGRSSVTATCHCLRLSHA